MKPSHSLHGVPRNPDIPFLVKRLVLMITFLWSFVWGRALGRAFLAVSMPVDFHFSFIMLWHYFLPYHFFLGSYCKCFVTTVPAESCDYFTVQCRAGVCTPTLIHPFVVFIGRDQGTSETSENKCADIRKLNSCL